MNEFIKNKVLIYLILFVLILIILTIIFLPKNNSNQSENSANTSNNDREGVLMDDDGKTYKCLMDSNTQMGKINNEIFEFVVNDKKDLDWGEIRKDNGVREFSIDQISNDSHMNKLYLIRYKNDESYLMNGITLTYQVCDKNNNTISISYYEDKNINPISSDEGSGNSLSSETQVYGIFMPKVPGKYRYDGLAFYKGEWVLVARLEGVNFK